MSYHWIDLNTFPRRDHFAYFLTMENPIMNLTQDVDITEWNEKRRAKGLPFFLSFQYCMGQAANAVPAFRQRIRSGGIVEYDSCRCSYTVAAADGTFRYCVADTSLPFDRYLQEAQAAQRVAEQEARLTDEEDKDSLFFVSSIPWLSYSALSLPHMSSAFSVPNLTIGKYREEYRPMRDEEGRVLPSLRTVLPLSVLVNHALVDGAHLGQFYAALEAKLREF